MPDKKISQLVDGGASQALDAYVIARTDGVNYKIAGTAIAAAATSVGTLSSLTVSGDLTVDTSTLKVDSTNNRVGVGTASPDVTLDLEAAAGSSTALVMLKNTSGASASNIAQMQFWSGNTFGGLEQIASIHGINPNAGSNNGGTLVFSTSSNGTATTPTERMRLDASGNLGLGVTPSAWSNASNYGAMQMRNASLYFRTGASELYVGNNHYYNGTNWVYVSSTEAARYDLIGGQHKWFTAPSGTAGNAISFTQAMTLDASGNLLVGGTSAYRGSRLLVRDVNRTQTSTTANVQISTTDTQAANIGASIGLGGQVGGDEAPFGYISGRKENSTSGNYGGYLAFATPDGGGTVSERGRFTAAGYFKASPNGTYNNATGTYHEFVSTSDNTGTVVVKHTGTSGAQYGITITTVNDQNDATRYFWSGEGAGVERGTLRSNGGLANYSANNVNLASDERLKKDIAPLASTWDKLKAIEVVNFRYKDCNEDDPALYGVIAQQVQPIVPELVVVTREAVEAKDAVLDEDGNEVEPAVEAKPEYYGIREQPMYWLAIKALQEAQARIESLEARLAALES